jgi:hypothetical protein
MRAFELSSQASAVALLSFQPVVDLSHALIKQLFCAVVPLNLRLGAAHPPFFDNELTDSDIVITASYYLQPARTKCTTALRECSEFSLWCRDLAMQLSYAP